MIQLKFICTALFTMYIISKQLCGKRLFRKYSVISQRRVCQSNVYLAEIYRYNINIVHVMWLVILMYSVKQNTLASNYNMITVQG